MKNAMLILGIIGAILGFGGSIMTMIGGFAGTAAGVFSDSKGTADSGAFVFWTGGISIALNVFALITSIIGGTAKRKSYILTFSLATLSFGILSIYMYNWFSGLLIAIGGLLGAIGSREGEADSTAITKLPVFYIMAVIVLISAVSGILVKNGKEFVKDTESAKHENDSPPSTASQNESSPVPSEQSQLPFTGKRMFNFSDGNGTAETIEIQADGHTKVEFAGSMQSVVEYEGPFSNPIRMSEYDLFIQGNMIYQLQSNTNTVMRNCKEEGAECSSELYPL